MSEDGRIKVANNVNTKGMQLSLLNTSVSSLEMSLEVAEHQVRTTHAEHELAKDRRDNIGREVEAMRELRDQVRGEMRQEVESRNG